MRLRHRGVRPHLALCLAVIILLGGCAVAHTRPQAAPRSPGSELVERMTFPPLDLTVPRVGREVERRVLPNGLVLYLASDPSLPVLKAYALFRAGSLYEEPSRPGVAQFTAAQLRSGGTEGQRLALDLQYVAECRGLAGLWLDLKIMVWTLSRLTGKGAN